MDITVKNLYINGSPRKIRPILAGLRGQSAKNAMNTLYFTRKAAALTIYELVKSGVAAGKEQYLEPEQLFISAVACNEGPRLKRIQPWSKGQARRITKRKSHLVLTLTDNKPEESVKSKPVNINKKAKTSAKR